MALLVGPIICFSEYGGLAAPSLPYNADLAFSLVFEKKLFIDPAADGTIAPSPD